MDNERSTAHRIRIAMERRGIKQVELSERTGINKSNISAYLSGKYIPKSENMIKIADVLEVNAFWLTGASVSPDLPDPHAPLPKGMLPLPRLKATPLIGKIACGTPILAQENIGEYVNVPENVGCDFCLRAQGDSMVDARIHNGDIVYIREQPMVENGDIAAVIIGEEATLKRVYMEGDTLTLIPCNSSYAPMTFTGPELNNIRIIGKAIGFISTLK